MGKYLMEWECMGKNIHFMAANPQKKKREREEEVVFPQFFQGHTPSDLSSLH
jgi:hypothetical protein